MTQSLMEKKREIEEAFPDLSQFEVAQLALGQTQKSKSAEVTIGEIIKVLRAKQMRKELERPRAKIQSDGSIKRKDMGTYRTYDTNWERLEKKYGELAIDEFTEEMALDFCSRAMQLAKKRHQISAEKREARGLRVKEENGHHAYNRALDALATVIRYAQRQGLIDRSPLLEIPRKRLSETDRHGLSPEQVDEILRSALSGGNDPQLDYLMLLTIVETACRAGGILNLQLGDIDLERQTIRFHEKGGKSRKQPVSRELAETLIEFATKRGSSAKSDPVFRFHPQGHGKGRAVTARRFERLWERIGEDLKWVAEKQISNHWLRHTTLTWVERATASPSVTSKFAGHGPENVTATYTSARLAEVAGAFAAVFGKDHPLAEPSLSRRKGK